MEETKKISSEIGQSKERFGTKLARFHDKHYKLLLLIPAIILLFSFIYLGVFYSKTGDFIYRAISLTGGTTVTIYEKKPIDQVKDDLSGKLESPDVRGIYDLITREQKAFIIETKSDANTTRTVLEEYLGYTLNEENSSFEFTGASLSSSFFRQLVIAVILAFVFMAIVVFIMFRTFVPSTAIIISAFADILMTLVLFNLLGYKLSSAGIVAFLMLIGYSVDTDILLTNRVLKSSHGSLNEKIFKAFKTGLTMTLTAITAVAISLILSNSFCVVLSQIFTILLIGLFFDIFNTWITNVSLIKWYVKKNESKI